MNKISVEEEVLESGAIEEIFREHVRDALSSMNIPQFAPSSLELARSEKEMAKCRLLAEKAQRKREIKLQESGNIRLKKGKKLSKTQSKNRSAFAPANPKKRNFRKRK